jgi:hypothetical protein
MNPDRQQGVVSGSPGQTVERRGSSVFCLRAEVPKPNASEGRRGSDQACLWGDSDTAHPKIFSFASVPAD